MHYVVVSLVSASRKELTELRTYLRGKWNKEALPSLIERWEIDLDEGAEDVEFTKPVIDLKKVRRAVVELEGVQVLEDVVKGKANNHMAYEPVLLVFHKGEKGQYPREATGIINEQSIEISTIVSGVERTKFFKILPKIISSK